MRSTGTPGRATTPRAGVDPPGSWAGLRRLLQRARLGEIPADGRIVRLLPQNPLILDDGRIQPAAHQQGVAEVVTHLEIAGSKLQGRPVLGDGLIQPARLRQQVAEGEVRRAVSGLQADGLPVLPLRGGQVSPLPWPAGIKARITLRRASTIA